MAIAKEKYIQLTKNIGVLSGGSDNVGIIDTPKGLYVLDPGGTDDMGNQIIQTLGELFPGKEIAGIFLTHAHTDHTGGITPILEHFSSTVYAGKTTANFLEIPESIAMIYSGSLPGKEMADRDFLMDHPVQTDVIITDSQEIDLGGIIAKAIELPGHCPGMTGFIFFDKEAGKKVFFLGDAFFGMKMLGKIWIPFILDPVAFRSSVEKIERISADYYVPGHGETCTIDKAGCVAEHNIMITYEFEDLIIKLIGSGCNEISSIIESTANYAGMKLKSVNYHLILCTLKSYMASLERDGIIENYMESNRLKWRIK